MEFGERDVFEVFVVGNKDIVAGLLKLVEVETDGFINPTADAVPADGGFVNLFRDNNSEASLPSFVVAKNKAKVGTTQSFTVAINIFYATTRVESVSFVQHYLYII